MKTTFALDCAVASIAMFIVSIVLWITGGVLYLVGSIDLARVMLPLTAALVVVFAFGAVLCVGISWLDDVRRHFSRKGEA